MTTVNPTQATTATAAARTSQPSASASLATNFETFLTLLTAQLQNQDPLSPMDTKDFTNQLVQFTGVEQQLRTNDLLSSLTDLTKASAGGTAVSYLGREVTAMTPDATLGTTGGADWTYTMPRNAQSNVLRVVNEQGRTVASLTGETGSGEHAAVWDGRTSGGTRAPAGTYRLVVEAVDSSRSVVAATVSRKGVVDGVDMTGASPMLQVGGTSVPLAAISRIRS